MITLKPLATAAIASLSLMLGGTALAADANSNAVEANMFGGPVYAGAPALQITAALVQAGGGPEAFTFPKALVSMLGQETVNAEVAKLTTQYGAKNVEDFLSGMTFAVNDGLKRATEAGVKLPAAPADLKGVSLARALVYAGVTPDGTWWSGYVFDQLLSHGIHLAVMTDINTGPGYAIDHNAHQLLNQAMYDVAHALGDDRVQLATLH